MFRAKSVSLFFVFLLILAIGSVEATILRVDFCGGQFTKDQGVPMIKTRNNTVKVRGDLVDTITGVTAPAGIAVSVGTKTGGGGTATSVNLTITPQSTVANGNHNIKLNYLVELGTPDIFIVNVRTVQVNTITKNLPGNDILKGSLVTITASGAGLAGVRLQTQFQSLFTNFANVTTNNNTTFAFRGNAQQDTTLTVASFFDDAIGNGSAGSCETPLGNAQLAYKVALPDLAISKATRVYRFVQPQPEACAGGTFAVAENKFCTELVGALPNPTPENPHIEQVRNIGGILYIVSNPSAFPITTPFRVQLKNGITLLKEDTINSLEAGKHKILSYSRPVNTRKLMRDLNCPKCYDLQEPPHNWVDPIYTTIVDVGNQIVEQNENNNTQQSN